MIIRRSERQLVLIAQTDHAALAGEIMARWQLAGFQRHPRRETILTATRHHDEGWREEDAELHLDQQGQPLDFVAVPAFVKHRIWPRAAERLSARISPYVGALVAEHALTVHASMRDNPEWGPFFETMERRRDALLGDAGENTGTLRADYPFVRIGDLMSLIFCNEWTSPRAGAGYRAILRGTILEIAPDPFAGARVPLQVEARAVPARAYSSAAELRDQLDAASPYLLAGEAVGVATT